MRDLDQLDFQILYILCDSGSTAGLGNLTRGRIGIWYAGKGEIIPILCFLGQDQLSKFGISSSCIWVNLSLLSNTIPGNTKNTICFSDADDGDDDDDDDDDDPDPFPGVRIHERPSWACANAFKSAWWTKCTPASLSWYDLIFPYLSP